MRHSHWPPVVWLTRLAASLGVFVFALFAVAAHAGTYSFTSDIPITLSGSGITVYAVSGSSANLMDIQANTVSVTVGTSETFTLRYPGPGAGDLANNGGLASCNVVNGNNDVTVTGPATVVFTPAASPTCGAAAVSGGSGGGGSASSAPATVTLAAPNGGQSLIAGSTQDVFWSGSGGITSLRLLLSTDGGTTYPTLIADAQANDGHYSWTVPAIATSAARVKIEAVILGGAVGASDASDANFAILPSTVAEPAPTIDADKELPPAPASPCLAGMLIKTASNPAVYYCGKDAKRYVFPDQWTYFSWYKDFSSVLTIAPDVLASIPLGGNVTYKPGSLVKITTDPKVYVVSRGGTLRWVTSESLAISLFGANWATMVHDVPDSFFLNYVIGEPLF